MLCSLASITYTHAHKGVSNTITWLLHTNLAMTPVEMLQSTYTALSSCHQCSGELSEAEEGRKAELKSLNPRLDALEAQYGPMAGAIAHRATATSLASSMLEVHLVCVAPSAGKKMGRQTKKIPGRISCKHGTELSILCTIWFMCCLPMSWKIIACSAHVTSFVNRICDQYNRRPKPVETCQHFVDSAGKFPCWSAPLSAILLLLFLLSLVSQVQLQRPRIPQTHSTRPKRMSQVLQV